MIINFLFLEVRVETYIQFLHVGHIDDMSLERTSSKQ
jgi:hypothetical protein